ncbi:MAG: A/G-specific adenine glycosylase, partial [Betaproteobacteria bacterium]|nr:A/G-specific adenine glycosylase [Betaproteobacteria bacterium]
MGPHPSARDSVVAPRAARGFAARLIAWQRAHGRHDLPWQGTRDAYRIWVSEVMLQQTQVATVIPYYERFIARFPEVGSLAKAEEDEVLRLWAGLGYYSRARNLLRAARALAADHEGSFPRSRAALQKLPGIGRSTAAAIAAFAFGRREAILDGNVRRVLARHFALRGHAGETRVAARLWRLAQSLVPARGVERYAQALMDLGAGVCTRRAPACDACPLKRTCRALALGRVDAFPAPALRKPKPRRKTAMLVLR